MLPPHLVNQNWSVIIPSYQYSDVVVDMRYLQGESKEISGVTPSIAPVLSTQLMRINEILFVLRDISCALVHLHGQLVARR
jgi:hypothetical protein